MILSHQRNSLKFKTKRFLVALLLAFIFSLSTLEVEANSIAELSKKYIGSPYNAHTLIGSRDKKEKLLINLNEMDCYTFIDYVLAEKIAGLNLEKEELSKSQGFKDALKNIRYKDGKVKFKSRNHFFTDWIENNTSYIKDVSIEVGGSKSRYWTKELNKNQSLIKGLKAKKRKIWFIPSKDINKELLSRIQSGDFIGLFTSKPGLDVSHVGIAIKKHGKTYIRNASSKENYMKVIDEELLSLSKNASGIVVLRSSS